MELKDAMAEYQKLDCTPKLDLDLENCSWQDISRILADARSSYDAKAKGPKGFLRNMLRKAGNHVDKMTPALGIIPNEYGLSVLKAALGWLFLVRTYTNIDNRNNSDIFTQCL